MTKYKNKSLPYYTFRAGRRTIGLLVDKVIIFRLMRKLHGRFWGVAGVVIMALLLGLCFVIQPDMLQWSTAFSDFGKDARTAPYLAASLFFGAYGLWRWKHYLKRTLKHSRPVTSLINLTILGLYMAAFFPVAWTGWPYRLHFLGVILFGTSMALLVVMDTLLSRVRKKKGRQLWQFLRLISFLLIVIGGYITYGSAEVVNWYELALLGELLMFAGFSIWIIDKTYRGEGSRSRLSRLLRGLVSID